MYYNIACLSLFYLNEENEGLLPFVVFVPGCANVRICRQSSAILTMSIN